MRRSYERAVENLTTSASAGITENFQTNPRIPANNPRNDRSHDQLRPESGAAAIRVPRQATTERSTQSRHRAQRRRASQSPSSGVTSSSFSCEPSCPSPMRAMPCSPRSSLRRRLAMSLMASANRHPGSAALDGSGVAGRSNPACRRAANLVRRRTSHRVTRPSSDEGKAPPGKMPSDWNGDRKRAILRACPREIVQNFSITGR